MDTPKLVLDLPYEGPYLVVDRNEKWFEIQYGTATKRVSIDWLKPAYIYEDGSVDRSASSTGSQEEDGNLLSLSPAASPNAIQWPSTSSFAREQDVNSASGQRAVQTPATPAAFGSGTATGSEPCPSLFQHASADDDVVGDVRNLFSAFEPTTTIELSLIHI